MGLKESKERKTIVLNISFLNLDLCGISNDCIKKATDKYFPVYYAVQVG